MRLLLLITLMVAVAFSPAAALVSCASMTGADSPAAGMAMNGMAGEDCGSMADKSSQPHDAGCIAACTLVCPGFYAGPDRLAADAPALASVEFAIPATSHGLGAPSHLDPPPPRS